MEIRQVYFEVKEDGELEIGTRSLEEKKVSPPFQLSLLEWGKWQSWLGSSEVSRGEGK